MERTERGCFSGREIPQATELANEAVKFWSYEQEMILYTNIEQVLDCVERRKDLLKSSRIKKTRQDTSINNFTNFLLKTLAIATI
jgi:hypothetical protein